MQETTKGCECSSVHHANQPPVHWLCLHFLLSRKNSQHNEGPHAPWTFSLPPSPVRKKIQKSKVMYQLMQEQLLPCCHQTFEWTYSHYVDLSLHPSYDCNIAFYTLSFPSLWTVCFVCTTRKKQYFSLYTSICDNNKSNQIISTIVTQWAAITRTEI